MRGQIPSVDTALLVLVAVVLALILYNVLVPWCSKTLSYINIGIFMLSLT